MCTYNEQIRDLILPENKNLELREDSIRGVYVSNLSLIQVDSEKEIF